MNNREKMYERLELLRELGDSGQDSLLTELRLRELISKRYDFRNLALDLWYIENSARARAVQDVTSCFGDDRLSSLWLKCILLALNDVKSGRPCDFGAWRLDSPPMGIDTCSSNVHICAPSAMGFLLAQTEEHEKFVCISPGTIRDIVKQIRKHEGTIRELSR